jgi:hypothetical protein
MVAYPLDGACPDLLRFADASLGIRDAFSTQRQLPATSRFRRELISTCAEVIVHYRMVTRKGVGYLLRERPEGCFAQKVPDPFPSQRRYARILVRWCLQYREASRVDARRAEGDALGRSLGHRPALRQRRALDRLSYHQSSLLRPDSSNSATSHIDELRPCLDVLSIAQTDEELEPGCLAVIHCFHAPLLTRTVSGESFTVHRKISEECTKRPADQFLASFEKQVWD